MQVSKLTTLLLILFVASVTTSFKKADFTTARQTISPAVPLTLKAPSDVIRFKGVYDIDLSAPGWTEFNSCTNETINIMRGIWHIEYTDILKGSKETYQFHTNTSNYKLINRNTGVQYTGSYVSNSTLNLADYGSSGAVIQTLSVVLTTSGGGNNSMLKIDFHITFDANGNVTVYVDNFRAGCQ